MKADYKPAKIKRPVIASLNRNCSPFSKLLEDDNEVSDLLFEKELIENISLTNLTVTDCCFKGTVFSDCDFKGIRLSNIRFENCDLSNISLSGASCHQVEFCSCKLVGTNLSAATFNNVIIEHCHAHYINLSMNKIRNTLIADSDFQRGTMESSTLSDVFFESCNLSEMEFFFTPLKDIDLRSSRINGIRLNIKDLKGAVVNSFQALELAHLLGIIVKE